MCLLWQHLFVKKQKQMFVTTHLILLRQKFCCNKHTFVTTNSCLSWQNMAFVMTKVCLSQQNICCDKIVWHDKRFGATTIFCDDKSFVTTSILLLRQKTCFVMANTCLSWQKWYLWQLLPMIYSCSLLTGLGEWRGLFLLSADRTRRVKRFIPAHCWRD